jgi:hypothetical protein
MTLTSTLAAVAMGAYRLSLSVKMLEVLTQEITLQQSAHHSCMRIRQGISSIDEMQKALAGVRQIDEVKERCSG